MSKKSTPLQELEAYVVQVLQDSETETINVFEEEHNAFQLTQKLLHLTPATSVFERPLLDYLQGWIDFENQAVRDAGHAFLFQDPEFCKASQRWAEGFDQLQQQMRETLGTQAVDRCVPLEWQRLSLQEKTEALHNFYGLVQRAQPSPSLAINLQRPCPVDTYEIDQQPDFSEFWTDTLTHIRTMNQTQRQQAVQGLLTWWARSRTSPATPMEEAVQLLQEYGFSPELISVKAAGLSRRTPPQDQKEPSSSSPPPLLRTLASKVLTPFTMFLIVIFIIMITSESPPPEGTQAAPPPKEWMWRDTMNLAFNVAACPLALASAYVSVGTSSPTYMHSVSSSLGMCAYRAYVMTSEYTKDWTTPDPTFKEDPTFEETQDFCQQQDEKSYLRDKRTWWDTLLAVPSALTSRAAVGAVLTAPLPLYTSLTGFLVEEAKQQVLGTTPTKASADVSPEKIKQVIYNLEQLALWCEKYPQIVPHLVSQSLSHIDVQRPDEMIESRTADFARGVQGREFNFLSRTLFHQLSRFSYLTQDKGRISQAARIATPQDFIERQAYTFLTQQSNYKDIVTSNYEESRYQLARRSILTDVEDIALRVLGDYSCAYSIVRPGQEILSGPLNLPPDPATLRAIQAGTLIENTETHPEAMKEAMLIMQSLLVGVPNTHLVKTYQTDTLPFAYQVEEKMVSVLQDFDVSEKNINLILRDTNYKAIQDLKRTQLEQRVLLDLFRKPIEATESMRQAIPPSLYADATTKAIFGTVFQDVWNQQGLRLLTEALPSIQKDTQVYTRETTQLLYELLLRSQTPNGNVNLGGEHAISINAFFFEPKTSAAYTAARATIEQDVANDLIRSEALQLELNEKSKVKPLTLPQLQALEARLLADPHEPLTIRPYGVLWGSNQQREPYLKTLVGLFELRQAWMSLPNTRLSLDLKVLDPKYEAAFLGQPVFIPEEIFIQMYESSQNINIRTKLKAYGAGHAYEAFRKYKQDYTNRKWEARTYIRTLAEPAALFSFQEQARLAGPVQTLTQQAIQQSIEVVRNAAARKDTIHRIHQHPVGRSCLLERDLFNLRLLMANGSNGIFLSSLVSLVLLAILKSIEYTKRKLRKAGLQSDPSTEARREQMHQQTLQCLQYATQQEGQERKTRISRGETVPSASESNFHRLVLIANQVLSCMIATEAVISTGQLLTTLVPSPTYLVSTLTTHPILGWSFLGYVGVVSAKAEFSDLAQKGSAFAAKLKAAGEWIKQQVSYTLGPVTQYLFSSIGFNVFAHILEGYYIQELQANVIYRKKPGGTYTPTRMMAEEHGGILKDNELLFHVFSSDPLMRKFDTFYKKFQDAEVGLAFKSFLAFTVFRGLNSFFSFCIPTIGNETVNTMVSLVRQGLVSILQSQATYQIALVGFSQLKNLGFLSTTLLQNSQRIFAILGLLIRAKYVIHAWLNWTYNTQLMHRMWTRHPTEPEVDDFIDIQGSWLTKLALIEGPIQAMYRGTKQIGRAGLRPLVNQGLTWMSMTIPQALQLRRHHLETTGEQYVPLQSQRASEQQSDRVVQLAFNHADPERDPSPVRPSSSLGRKTRLPRLDMLSQTLTKGYQTYGQYTQPERTSRAPPPRSPSPPRIRGKASSRMSDDAFIELQAQVNELRPVRRSSRRVGAKMVVEY